MGTPYNNSQELTQTVLNHAVFQLHQYKHVVFEFYYWEVHRALYPEGKKRAISDEEYAQKQLQIDRLLAYELNGTWWFVSSLYCWWYDIQLQDTQRYMLGILDRLYNEKLRVENLLPGERSFITLMQSNSLAPLFVFMKSIYIGLESLQSFSKLISRTWAAFGSTKVSSQKPVVIQVKKTMKSLSVKQTSSQPSNQADWHAKAASTVREVVHEANNLVNTYSNRFNQYDWNHMVVSVGKKGIAVKSVFASCENKIRYFFKQIETQIQIRSPVALDDLEVLKQDYEKIDADIKYVIENLRAKKSVDPLLQGFNLETARKYFRDLQAAIQEAWLVTMPLLSVQEKSLRIVRLRGQLEKQFQLLDSKDVQYVKRYFDIKNVQSPAFFWQERYCALNKELRKLNQTDLQDVYVESLSGIEVLKEVSEKLNILQKSAIEFSWLYLKVKFEETKEKIKNVGEDAEGVANIEVGALTSDINQMVEKFNEEVVCFAEEVCPGVSLEKNEYVKQLKKYGKKILSRLCMLALLSSDDRQSKVKEYQEIDKNEQETKDEQDKSQVSIFVELNTEIDSINKERLSNFDNPISHMDKMLLIHNYALRVFRLSADKKTLLDPNNLRRQKRLFEWLQEVSGDAEKSEWKNLDNKVLKTFEDLNTAFSQCLGAIDCDLHKQMTDFRQSIQAWNESIGSEQEDGDLIFLRQFFNDNEQKLNPPRGEVSSRSTQPIGQKETAAGWMATWVSQILSPMTLPQRWQAIAHEQEESQKTFLILIREKAPESATKTVSNYVLYFQTKLDEYRTAFEGRYSECNDIENATALYLAAFKNQYIAYRDAILLAQQYLQALENPAQNVDKLGYEATSEEIRAKAHALFLKAAPDRNKNKGVLVEEMSTALMQFMLVRKTKLLTSNQENDVLEVRPFYDRYDEIYDEVDALQKQAFQMAADLKSSVLLKTAIVPVYDADKKVDTLDREFDEHVYQKVAEGKISQKDAYNLTGLFSFYCHSFKLVARLSISTMDYAIKTVKVNEDICGYKKIIAEENAKAEKAEAAAEAAEAAAEAATAILSQYGDMVLKGFQQDINDGKFSAQNPVYQELLKVHSANSYLQQEDKFLVDCLHLLQNSGGKGCGMVVMIDGKVNSISKPDESQQAAEVSTGTQNGVFLSVGSGATASSSNVATSALVL